MLGNWDVHCRMLWVGTDSWCVKTMVFVLRLDLAWYAISSIYHQQYKQ